MEQAVGDQCPLKSLMCSAEWREHAAISQAVAHLPASRAEGGGDGVQAAAWPGRTVCKATHDDHTAWAVQTPPAPLCMIDLGR